MRTSGTLAQTLLGTHGHTSAAICVTRGRASKGRGGTTATDVGDRAMEIRRTRREGGDRVKRVGGAERVQTLASDSAHCAFPRNRNHMARPGLDGCIESSTTSAGNSSVFAARKMEARGRRQPLHPFVTAGHS